LKSLSAQAVTVVEDAVEELLWILMFSGNMGFSKRFDTELNEFKRTSIIFFGFSVKKNLGVFAQKVFRK